MRYFYELKEQFLIHCEARNLTDDTIHFYSKETVHFERFYDGDLDSINEFLIEKYIIYLKRSTNANEITINSYLRALRAIIYYGIEIGVVKPFKVHLLKVDKKVKATYTKADLEALVKSGGHKSMVEYKVWALECFLLSTGVRISTAINIKTEDLDIEHKLVIIRHSKNRKQQILPLTDSTIDIIQEYLRVFGSHEYLFPNRQGKKMDRHTLEQQIQRYNQRRGVKTTSAHAFRHTYAKMSVLKGVDVFTLQKLLGHSTIAVTKEYVDLFTEDLRQNWCPLDAI